MTDTDQEREDDVLRRMLKTPPKPHKSKSEKVGKGGDPKITPKAQKSEG